MSIYSLGDTEHSMKRAKDTGHSIDPSKPGQHQKQSKPQSSASGFDDNFVDTCHHPSDTRMHQKAPYTDPLMHRDKCQDGMSSTPNPTFDYRANDLCHLRQLSQYMDTRPFNQQQMPINARYSYIGPVKKNCPLKIFILG